MCQGVPFARVPDPLLKYSLAAECVCSASWWHSGLFQGSEPLKSSFPRAAEATPIFERAIRSIPTKSLRFACIADSSPLAALRTVASTHQYSKRHAPCERGDSARRLGPQFVGKLLGARGGGERGAGGQSDDGAQNTSSGVGCSVRARVAKDGNGL